MSTSSPSGSHRLLTLDRLSQSIPDSQHDLSPHENRDRMPATLYVLDDLPSNCFFYPEESLALIGNRSVSIEFVSRTLDPISGRPSDRTAHHENLRIDESDRFESLVEQPADSSSPKSRLRSSPKAPTAKSIESSPRPASPPAPSDRDHSHHPSPPHTHQEDPSPPTAPPVAHPFLREGRARSTGIERTQSPSPEPSNPSDSLRPTRTTPTHSKSSPQITKEASTDEITKEPSTDEITKEASTDEIKKEASTNEITKEASTDEITKEASTAEITKESSTDEITKDASTDEQVVTRRGIKRSARFEDSISTRRPPKMARIQANPRPSSARLSQRKSNSSWQSDQEEQTESQKIVETSKSTPDERDTSDDLQSSTQDSLLMSQECTRISRRVSRRLQLKRSFSQSQETSISSQTSS